MTRRIAAAVLCVGLVGVGPAPATAQEERLRASTVEGPIEIRAGTASTVQWRGRTFTGPFEIKLAGDGLVLVEHLPLDNYLYGIQEVPFSWEMEALKAQAVAARTFLARTISNGRVGAAGTYGFDICATDQCQVYRGLDKVLAEGGDRWKLAVDSTATEIMLYEDRPALAMYSSTAGPRTRNIEDVFGSEPRPYLVGVESPGEASPFVSWTVRVPGPWMEAIMRDAELLTGALDDIEVTTTSDGNGEWIVTVSGSRSTETLSTWQFRREMNSSGPAILPDDLPADRPDGRAYPQTVLSPTFDVERSWAVSNDFTWGYVDASSTYSIVGSGWGHQVGMSQYGAQAMASDGAGYDEILSHYYTGLFPEPAGAHLPEIVAVGLDWAEPTYELTANGTFDIIADDVVIADDVSGTWTFTASGSIIEVIPPGGFGAPPVLSDLPPVSDHQAGFVVQVVGELSKDGEVRFVVFRGPHLVHEGEWKTATAGPVSFVWDAFYDGAPAPPGSYRFLFYTRDDNGDTVQTAVVWIGR